MNRHAVFLVAVGLVGSPSFGLAPVRAQTALIIVGENVLVSSAESIDPHVEPHLAAHPDDPTHLVAGAMRFPPQVEQTSVSFVTMDGGESWTEVPLPGCRADVWLAFDADGTAYVSCLHRRAVDGIGMRTVVDVRRSDDGGLSWTGPATVPLGFGSSSDFPILLVDRGDGPRQGTVYIVRGQAFTPGGERRGFCDRPCWYGPSIARSTDRAGSFADPELHAVNNLTNQIFDGAVLSDGTLAIMVFDFQQSGRHSARRSAWLLLSEDGGQSLAPARFVADADVGRLAVDRSRGDRMHVVVQGTPELPMSSVGWSDPSHVYLLSSDDRGMEWSVPRRISDEAAGSPLNYLPMLAVNQEGVLGVAWYAGSSDQSGSCGEIFFTASLDGGATFSPSQKVSSAASCPRTAGNRVRQGDTDTFDVAERWPWGGDYNGMVAASDGSFHLVWADSRGGRYQIWSSRVEVFSR